MPCLSASAPTQRQFDSLDKPLAGASLAIRLAFSSTYEVVDPALRRKAIDDCPRLVTQPEEFQPSGPLLIDAHGTPVADPVWDLFSRVIRQTGPLPTLVEWDNNVPDWPTLAAEAARADAILRQEVNRLVPAC